MARRSSKADGALIVLVLIIGIPLYLISKAVDSVGWGGLIGGAIFLIVLALWMKGAKKRKRLRYLRDKYHDEVIVKKIFEGYFWEGQTQEQLRDSLGLPLAIDNKLLKTKTKEVWKYHSTGRNRYALRITLEDGVVSGWDMKS